MASKSFLSQMRGFTLIEISIVLVVIGLLLSGGLVALAPILENAKRTQTENTLTKIEDALLLYAIQNSCLPCPALNAGTAGTANAVTTGDYTTGCTANACTAPSSASVVPWVNLGLQPSDAADEWGTKITYHLSDTTNSTGTGCDNIQDGSNDAAAGGFPRTGTTFPVGCLNIIDPNP